MAPEVDRVRNRVGNSRGPFYREENKYKEIKVSCDQELGKGTSSAPRPCLCPASRYHPCPAQQESQVFLEQERNKAIDTQFCLCPPHTPPLFIWPIPSKQVSPGMSPPQCSLAVSQSTSECLQLRGRAKCIQFTRQPRMCTSRS